MPTLRRLGLRLPEVQPPQRGLGDGGRVSALVKQTGDTCEDVRVGLTNMGSVPLRAHAVEEALRGQPLNADTIARRPSRLPRAPTRRPTSTRARTTSAIWRGCCAGGRCETAAGLP